MKKTIRIYLNPETMMYTAQFESRGWIRTSQAKGAWQECLRELLEADMGPFSNGPLVDYQDMVEVEFVPVSITTTCALWLSEHI